MVLVRTMVRAASWRDAAPAGQLDQQIDIVAVARIVLGIDQLEVDARPDAQAVALQPDSMTCGRPIRIGSAMPSSSTTCAARSTRSSSPSA